MSYRILIFAWRFSTSKKNFTDRVSEICILKCRYRSWQLFCSDLKVDAPRGDAKAFYKCGATQHVLYWRFWKHCKEIHILDLLMNKIDNNLHIHVGIYIVYVLISTLSFFRLQTGRRHGDESEACCRYLKTGDYVNCCKRARWVITICFDGTWTYWSLVLSGLR